MSPHLIHSQTIPICFDHRFDIRFTHPYLSPQTATPNSQYVIGPLGSWWLWPWRIIASCLLRRADPVPGASLHCRSSKSLFCCYPWQKNNSHRKRWHFSPHWSFWYFLILKTYNRSFQCRTFFVSRIQETSDLRLPLLFFQFLLQRERVPQMDDLKGFDNALHSSLRWDSLVTFQTFQIVSCPKRTLIWPFCIFWFIQKGFQ